MAMSEEQKKAAAERLKAAREKKAAEKAAKEAEKKAEAAETKEKATVEAEAVKAEAEAPKRDMQAEQIEALQAQIEQLKSMLQMASQPQVVQVAASEEKIHFLWQAEVADDNVVSFGQGGMYGRIVGKTGSFYIPKNDFSRILDNLTRYFLEKRWLIVVDGLSAEEREALGVNYHDGELLDKKAFAKMVELGDEIFEIYPKLCESHKAMVGSRYYEAWRSGSRYVTRDRVETLERLTRESGSQVKSFTQILDDMAAERLKGE